MELQSYPWSEGSAFLDGDDWFFDSNEYGKLFVAQNDEIRGYKDLKRLVGQALQTRRKRGMN